MVGDVQLARRGLPILVGLVALVLSLSQPPLTGEATASTADPIARQALRGPYSPSPPSPSRSLALSLPGKFQVGRRAAVRVEGFAFAGDGLSMFVDPKGKKCPASASGRPDRAILLVEEILPEGGFQVAEAYRPRGPGDRSFCAYLESSSPQAGIEASQIRSVGARRLRAAAARGAVVTALKRHDFARRVVKSLRIDCRRKSRSAFSCRFSARLRGYRLKGRGRVRLGVELTYGFRVTAQGVRFYLTEDNEEGRRQ